MARLSPGRRVALDALMEAQATGRYVREVLDERARRGCAYDVRDTSFALRLALGVTGCMGCLDDALNAYLTKRSSVSPRVRMALRIAAYETLYLGTSPDVVVSQGVELVRSCARGAAGLANAVLRRVCTGRDDFLDALDAAEDQRTIVSHARQAGMPVWLMRRIEASCGVEAACGLGASQHEAPVLAVQVNPLRADATAALLDAAHAKPYELPGSYMVGRMGELVRSDSFACGDLVASDLYAQLIAAAATRSGSCLEIGAGRGTKTFMMHAHATRLGMERAHLALDLSEGKCRANTERIEHAGFGALTTLAGDARDLDTVLAGLDASSGRFGHSVRLLTGRGITDDAHTRRVDAESGSDEVVPSESGQTERPALPDAGHAQLMGAQSQRVLFDTVFIDAPCSGTGTMRRHPEIPWRLTPDEVDRALPELQLAILMAAASRVAPGGELLYATCSVLTRENRGVIEAFLGSEAGGDFSLVPLSGAHIFTLPGYGQARELVTRNEDKRGLFQTVPAPGDFDGHFCARLVRRE